MAKAIIQMVVPAAVGNGAACDVGAYSKLGFPTLTTHTAGTVQFQESHDGGLTYKNVGTALTAVGVADVKFSDSATHVRATVTAGTPASTSFVSGIQFPGSSTMAKNAVLGNNLVDKLLPTVGKLRTSLFAKMGVRQFRVFTVTRTWDGGRRGEGIATETAKELTPPPQVSMGLTFKLEPCGLNEAGAVILREVDLRYTEDELDGRPIARDTEFFYRITDGQGQSITTRTFQLSAPPYPDREDSIGWIIHLTPSTEDD